MTSKENPNVLAQEEDNENLHPTTPVCQRTQESLTLLRLVFQTENLTCAKFFSYDFVSLRFYGLCDYYTWYLRDNLKCSVFIMIFLKSWSDM